MMIPRPAPRAECGSLGDAPPKYASLDDAARDLRDAVMTLCAVGVCLTDHERVEEVRLMRTAIEALNPLREMLEVIPYDDEVAPEGEE